MIHLLNGEVIAPLTGWQAVGLATFVFVTAAVIRRVRGWI
jgi:hypothetical protein